MNMHVHTYMLEGNSLLKIQTFDIDKWRANLL